VLRVGALARMRSSALVRNTGWMTGAHSLRAALQAGYFVLIARALGVEGLGELAAALAIVFALVPFSGLGAGNLLIFKVAREPAAFATHFGYTLKATAVSSVVLTGAAAVLAELVFSSISLRLMVALAVAELFFGRLCETAGQAFQAVERLSMTALVSVILPALRLLAAVSFTTVGANDTAAGWATWYLAAAATGGVATTAIAAARLGRPRLGHRTSWSDLRLGFYFSIGLSSSLIYGDIDKALLARLASLSIAGIYTAAYRIASFAFVPVMALLTATYARFFKHGASGVRAATAFAKQLAPYAVSYSALAGAVIYMGAPLVPVALGDGYQPAVDVLRWLAPLPVLQAIAYLAGDVLTGSDRQGIRSLLQIAAAGLNVGLNLVLIPAYSWRGAVWATLASFAFLASALWLTAWLVARNEKRDPAPGVVADLVRST
jgi:O-antigen/teichoic acid export membrane protein